MSTTIKKNDLYEFVNKKRMDMISNVDKEFNSSKKVLIDNYIDTEKIEECTKRIIKSYEDILKEYSSETVTLVSSTNIRDRSAEPEDFVIENSCRLKLYSRLEDIFDQVARNPSDYYWVKSVSIKLNKNNPNYIKIMDLYKSYLNEIDEIENQCDGLIELIKSCRNGKEAYKELIKTGINADIIDNYIGLEKVNKYNKPTAFINKINNSLAEEENKQESNND